MAVDAHGRRPEAGDVMNDRITAGAASLMAALLVATGMVRYAVAPPRSKGRHRQTPLLGTLDELLGPWSEYTDFEHAPGPIAQRFNPCPTCDRDTVGVAHRDGSWTCGECLTTSGVAS